MTLTPEIKQRSAMELIKFVVYIVTVVAAAMLFYGAIDKRVTILESDMKYKVDEGKLYNRLDQLKEDIYKKIETEIKKVK